MSNLPESSTWESGIFQLETNTPALGGANGQANTQAKQLANRTKYLYDNKEDSSNKQIDWTATPSDDEYFSSKATTELLASTQTSISSYFMYSTASDVSGYKKLLTIPSSGSSQTIVGSGLAVGSHTLEEWITEPNYPNKLFYPVGWTSVHFHAKKTGSGSATIKVEIYKRTSGGTETLIGTTDSTTILTNSETAYSLEFYNTNIVTLNATDRIVIKVVAVVTSNTPDVTMYFEDAYFSRVNLPVQQTSYSVYYYEGVKSGAPTPSASLVGKQVWFTDKPTSKGGAFIVRESTGTPGSYIYDRIGGGVIEVASKATILATYDATLYDGCVALVSDGGKYDLRAIGGYWTTVAYPTTTTSLSSSSGVATIDCSAGYSRFSLALTENVTSWSFTNLPTSGRYRDIYVEVTQHASSAKTCVSPASSGKTAGFPWVVSPTLSSVEILGMRIFSDGTVHLFPSGVMS